jgi:hypothetical protein
MRRAAVRSGWITAVDMPVKHLDRQAAMKTHLSQPTGIGALDGQHGMSSAISSVVRRRRRRHLIRRRLHRRVGSRLRHDVARVQHRASIIPAISSGAAKITAERSPIMPAGMIAGTSFSGPSLLESVIKCRLRSQKARVLPSAVVTR